MSSVAVECTFRVRVKKEARDDFSWVAAVGLGAFIGFMAGYASDAAKHTFFVCNCGNRIDLTQWKGERFNCPNCGELPSSPTILATFHPKQYKVTTSTLPA